MDVADSPSPISVSSLSHHPITNDNPVVDTTSSPQDRLFLPRLVTPHPAQDDDNATVETKVERVGRRFRVVIGNGPDHTADDDDASSRVHASFLLSEQAQFPTIDEIQANQGVAGASSLFHEPSLLAWTHFRNSEGHDENEKHGNPPRCTFLAVLVHPRLVSIHNVYPAQSAGSEWTVQQEGWTVPLPLECSAIFAIPAGGLLLQRVPEAAELEAVLLSPPPALPTSTKTPPPLTIDPAALLMQDEVHPHLQNIPSLFTLRHYQEDLTPLAQHDKQLELSSAGSATPFWNDPLEQVLWVGEAYEYDSDDTEEEGTAHNRTTLMVSYNIRQKRHAIWSLERAPTPPQPPSSLPLYYASSQSGSNLVADAAMPPALLWEQAGGNERMDVTSLDVSTLVPPQQQQPRPRRQEALAEALGVHSRKKTPRHSLASTSLASNNRTPLPPSFVSPAPPPQHDVTLASVNPFLLDSTTTTTTAGPQQQAAAEPTNFFATLQAHHCTTSLYQEADHKSPSAARNIFLVSNSRATGLDVLVWVVDNLAQTPQEARGGRARRLQTLRHHPQRRPQKSPSSSSSLRQACLFQTVWNPHKTRTPPMSSKKKKPATTKSRRSVQPCGTLSCLDAQPVQATPLLWPARQCGGGEGASRTATDLLVLVPNTSNPQLTTKLQLYRAHTLVTPIKNDSEEDVVTALVDPVGARVGLAMRSSSSVHRVTVQLTLPCQWAEQALCAIQASLEAEEQAALLFRADCVRLFQRLTEQAPTLMHLPYKAVVAVVLAVCEWDLGGRPRDPPQRQQPMQEESRSAWEELQASEFGQNLDLFPFSVSDREKDPAAAPGSPSWLVLMYWQSKPQLVQHLQQQKQLPTAIAPLLFDPLHLLFEDAKLGHHCSPPPDLVQLLIEISQHSTIADTSQSNKFLQHYSHSSSSVVAQQALEGEQSSQGTARQASFTRFEHPPSALHWVDNVLGKRSTRNDYYYSELPSQPLHEINPACIYTRFASRALPLVCQENQEAAARVVELLIRERFRDQQSIQEGFVAGIAFPLLSLLNRLTNDASETIMAAHSRLSPEGFALIGRNDLSLNMRGAAVETNKQTPHVMSATVEPGEESGQENNQRSGDEGAFSDEDKDGLVPLEYTSSMLFPDNRIHEAARLLRSSRPVFLRVPRVVEITDHEYEQLKQRKLALLVRRTLALPVGRGMTTVGSLQPLAAESLAVPELCLKGRVPPTNATLSLDQNECPPELKVWPEFHNGVAAGLRLPLRNAKDEGSQITRTWILYNKPPRSEMPSPEDGNNSNNTTNAALNNTKSHAHGGFLLALGLRGHLTALEMTDIYEYLTQGTITLTVGVLLGMAANKRGSCDMSVSKMLCLHIPSLIPQHFSAIDVASAVQAAAVTGVGLLYQRSSHRMMTEFLLNEIGKRPESDTSAFDREAYTLSCGIALGMVNMCVGEKTLDGPDRRVAGISDLRVEERLRRYINGGQSNEDEARRIQESNDRFSIPSSSNGVENEKCSIIFEANMINTDVTAPAATLALGLMYMKSGNHTVASVVSIPQTHFLLEFVRPDFLGLRIVAKSLILWDEVEPTQEWIESQLPPVVQQAYFSMQSIARRAMEGRTPVKSQRAVDYDRRAVRQIHTNIIAGACFSIGLRFAGTGDERAKKALFDCVLQMHKLREGNDPVSVVSKPEMPILETCLGQAALSLAMVLAGTGDLDALRLFKVLRWRDKDVVYGTHMVFGAAIGLLFLGGGTMTLGREPEDIAALVAAFFPRFPTESMDNQYHLQAVRHLYALAARRSDISAIDVDTGERVYVPVETVVSSGIMSQKMQAPCLLRNSDLPTRAVKIVSNEFYPMVVRLHSGSNVFHVKRRASDVKRKDAHDSHLGKSGTMQLLSQLDCLSVGPVEGPFLRKLLAEEQAKDRYGVVLLFLNLFLHAGSRSSLSTELMWDLRLMRSYQDNAAAQFLSMGLDAELLAFLLEMTHHQLSEEESRRSSDETREILRSILSRL